MAFIPMTTGGSGGGGDLTIDTTSIGSVTSVSAGYSATISVDLSATNYKWLIFCYVNNTGSSYFPVVASDGTYIINSTTTGTSTVERYTSVMAIYRKDEFIAKGTTGFSCRFPTNSGAVLNISYRTDSAGGGKRIYIYNPSSTSTAAKVMVYGME